jgi:hypothetical protein
MRRAVFTAVAIPNGIGQSGARRLSLFLAPHLESDEGDRLDLFPALADWPAAIGRPEVGFLLEVAGHGAVETRVVSAPPSSQLWRALFRPGQQVSSRTDHGIGDRPLITYPYADLSADLERRYQELGGASVTRLPSRAAMTATLGDLMDVARRGVGGRATADEQVRGLLRRAAERVAGRRGSGGDDQPPVVVGDDEPPGPRRDLAQFEAFHHVLDHPAADRPAGPEAAARQIDLHAAVAALGDHPWLLRRLGLVVDLELLGALFPSSATDPGRLRALPLWHGHEPEGIEVRTPWLAYVSGPTMFRTADRPGRGPGGDLVDGLLAIGDGGWDVVQVDVDGGVLKAIGAAASAAARAERDDVAQHANDTGEEGLPWLRSAGLTLARRSSAGVVHRSFGDQRRLVAAAPEDVQTALFAADVTRGYRMDVREDRTGRWRSLQARIVTATVEGGPAVAPAPAGDTEGLVRRGVRHPRTTEFDPPPTYVHDALCRWDGWSLVAPHPGLALSKDGRAPDPAHPETMPVPSENPAVPGGILLSLEVRVQPGTLPRLRYGERYHVRLRAVDLAGNGPTLTDADQTTAADAGRRLVLPIDPDGVAVLRYEPVGSPELVVRTEVGAGESLAHLVIRSDVGVGAADWAARHGVGGATCERHVVPPKTSQLQAERHGMFDAAIGTGAGVAAMYEIARRDKGQLHDAHARTLDGVTHARPARLDSTPHGHYVVDPSQDLIVPYLPDPLAEAVTVAGAPGAQPGVLVRMDATGSTPAPAPAPLGPGEAPESLLRIAFGAPDRWPDVLPFRLVLAEGDGPPRWDPARRALVLSLPKGGRARIALSCAPPRSRLEELAPRSWARRRPRDAAYVALAEAGRVWQISPARTVELVHAVQRPVEAPAISSLTPTRAPGETSALLTGRIRLHGASSERVDLVADWDEAPAAGPPEAAPRHAHVLEHPLHVGHDLPPGVTAPRAAVRYDEGASELVLTRPAAPAAPAPDGPIQPTPTPRHEFGDTRHRRVRYRAVATSRFREYLPEALTADPANITRQSEPFTVDVLSSARPQAPQVVQVLPTFAWRRGGPAGTGVVNTRRGGGLRVYLQPPWFTSGEGELLGMVLWPSGVFSPDQPFVTRWGRDPIWRRDGPAVPPTLRDAIDPVATTIELRLADHGSPIVAVAGYPVTWDADRGLWSCDVGLRMPNAYTPFVRLALVRWQPGSLPGLELSPLVLAEFAQPAPDRSLTVVRVAADTPPFDPDDPFPPQPLGVRLQLDGPGPPTRVDVTAQRRLPGTADEVGWVDATGAGIEVAETPLPSGSSARWAGRVSFPDANADRFRIVVRESELFPDGRVRVLFVETLEI